MKAALGIAISLPPNCCRESDSLPMNPSHSRRHQDAVKKHVHKSTLMPGKFKIVAPH